LYLDEKDLSTMANAPDPGGARIGKKNKAILPRQTNLYEAMFEGREPELTAVVNGGPAVFIKQPGGGDRFTRRTKTFGLFVEPTYHNGGVVQKVYFDGHIAQHS
jgi:hypothetical protein